MGLSDHRVHPDIAVSDLDRARTFYEEKLGLSGGTDTSDGGRTYPCAGGTELHLYPSPDNAGTSRATLAGWSVDDIEAVVAELDSNGVTFERYEDLNPDDRGIHAFTDGQVAWFRDPDGNIFGLVEPHS